MLTDPEFVPIVSALVTEKSVLLLVDPVESVVDPRFDPLESESLESVLLSSTDDAPPPPTFPVESVLMPPTSPLSLDVETESLDVDPLPELDPAEDEPLESLVLLESDDDDVD